LPTEKFNFEKSGKNPDSVNFGGKSVNFGYKAGTTYFDKLRIGN